MEDQPERPAPKFNPARRTIGAAVCLAPLALMMASAVAGRVRPRRSGTGVGLAIAGLLVATLNFHLGVIRPSVYARRHGSTDGLRNISGIPLFGTIFVVAGGLVGFGDWRAAAIGSVALALDLGGLPWFLVATWRDESLWDA
jgi:hypothetical protein